MGVHAEIIDVHLEVIQFIPQLYLKQYGLLAFARAPLREVLGYLPRLRRARKSFEVYLAWVGELVPTLVLLLHLVEVIDLLDGDLGAAPDGHGGGKEEELLAGTARCFVLTVVVGIFDYEVEDVGEWPKRLYFSFVLLSRSLI